MWSIIINLKNTPNKQVLKSSQGQEKHDLQKSDRLTTETGNQKKVDAILNFHIFSEHT